MFDRPWGPRRAPAASGSSRSRPAEQERNAERTVQLINRREMLPDGTLSAARLIPKEGAVTLLRNDPLMHGPRLFHQHCESCHTYNDSNTPTRSASEGKAASTAPDLYGFATRSWLKGLLSPG